MFALLSQVVESANEVLMVVLDRRFALAEVLILFFKDFNFVVFLYLLRVVIGQISLR